MEALKKGVRSSDNIQKILDDFDLLFERMNCKERRELCRQFIERIDVFQEEREDGRILKRIVFRFPVYYEEEGKRAENDEPDEVVTFEVDCTEHRVTASEAKATYAEIRAYVKGKYGMNVSSLYIAQVKRKYAYDGTKEYALYVTLPGYQGLYFQGVGENIRTEDFGFEHRSILPI